MSPEMLASQWLSLSCWLKRSVLPSALLLLGLLVCLRLINPGPVVLDHLAVLVGFSALYFVLFRGGHMLMIRSLHKDMMIRHAEAYRTKLAALDPDRLKRRNLGFTLARVKRDILIEARDKAQQKRNELFPR
jgi:hypothetical protein